MNKQEFINKVKQMNYGDCFSLNFDDSHYTYITKTRWIDNHCFIVGGADDITITKTIWDGEEENVINELTTEIFKTLKLNDDTVIKMSDKSKITVTRKGGDSFRSGEFDNMITLK